MMPAAALFAALLIALDALAPAPLPSGDPYAIFARARRSCQVQSYPRYLRYTVTSSYMYKDRPFTDAVRNTYSWRDGRIAGHPVPNSREEDSKRLSGVPIQDLIFKYETNPNHNPVVVGEIKLAPMETFGLCPDTADAPFDPATGERAASEYEIALAGLENVAGHPCFHLTLLPRRKTAGLPLRDLYLDTVNLAPWRAVVKGLGIGGPFDFGDWQIDYTVRDGRRMIAGLQAMGPLHHLGAPTLSEARLTLGDFSYPDRVPVYEFGLWSSPPPVDGRTAPVATPSPRNKF